MSISPATFSTMFQGTRRGKEEKMKQTDALMNSCCAVVFCGGRATRVQSTLDGLPKALIPLDTTPYLDGLLNLFRLSGIQKVVLCISPLTSAIEKHIESGSRFKVDVRYSVDSGYVENAGALWAALQLVDTPLILCVNGDTIVEIDFRALVCAHVHSGGIATLVGSTRDDQPHPKAVEVGLNGWVKNIYELEQDAGRPVEISPHCLWMSNSGVYVFDRRNIARYWSRHLRVGKLEQGFLRTLAVRRLLWAFPNGDKYLLDLGTEDRLERAQSEINRIGSFFLQ